MPGNFPTHCQIVSSYPFIYSYKGCKFFTHVKIQSVPLQRKTEEEFGICVGSQTHTSACVTPAGKNCFSGSQNFKKEVYFYERKKQQKTGSISADVIL